MKLYIFNTASKSKMSLSGFALCSECLNKLSGFYVWKNKLGSFQVQVTQT